jgi:hypothetical protein
MSELQLFGLIEIFLYVLNSFSSVDRSGRFFCVISLWLIKQYSKIQFSSLYWRGLMGLTLRKNRISSKDVLRKENFLTIKEKKKMTVNCSFFTAWNTLSNYIFFVFLSLFYHTVSLKIFIYRHLLIFV